MPTSVSQGANQISYGYDTLDILTRETENGIVKTYSMDNFGKFIISNMGEVVTNYRYDRTNKLINENMGDVWREFVFLVLSQIFTRKKMSYMKKTTIILMGIIILILMSVTVFAESSILSTASVDGQDINISGHITNINKSVPVTLRAGSVENILYIWQTMSTEEGSFDFSFKMPDNTPSGVYEYMVSSDAVDTGYTGAIVYNSTESESQDIESEVSVNGRAVNITGKVLTDPHSVPVTLLVGDADNIIYLWQTYSETDGNFSFDFEMPDSASSGNYRYQIRTITGEELYVSSFNYITDNRIVCETRIDGQRINISGTVVNATGTNNVFFALEGDNDTAIYSAQTISGEDGKFVFDFYLPSTIEDGEYSYVLSTDHEGLEYEGTLVYTRPTYEIGCNISVRKEVFDVYVYLEGKPNIPTRFELEVKKEGEIIYTDDAAGDCEAYILFRMPETVPSGEYEIVICETCNNTNPYHSIVNYISPYAEINENFVNVEIDINIVDYVPTVTCSMSCTKDKMVTFLVDNISDGSSVAIDSVQYEDGRVTKSYRLPRISSSNDYNINAFFVDEEKTLAGFNFSLDFGLLTVSLRNEMTIEDGIQITMQSFSQSMSLLNRSATYTQSKTSSIIVPNLLANMDCTITLNGYERKIICVEEEVKYDPEAPTSQIDDNSVIYDGPNPMENKKQSYSFTASRSGKYYIHSDDCSIYVFDANGILLSETALNSRCYELTAGETYTVQSKTYFHQNAFVLVIKNIETGVISNQNITYQNTVTLSQNESGLFTLGNLKAEWYHSAGTAEYYAANGGLYVCENGVEIKLVDNVEAKFIVTDSNYIYFCDMLKNSNIYRCDKDGKNLSLFSSDCASWLYIKDGHLYYIDNTNGRVQKRK